MKGFLSFIACVCGIGAMYYVVKKIIGKPIHMVPIKKYELFQLEDLLNWFKQYDLTENDECCIINDCETTKYGFKLKGLCHDDINKVIVLVVFDKNMKKIKEAIGVVYDDIDPDIKSMIKDKKVVILE